MDASTAAVPGPPPMIATAARNKGTVAHRHRELRCLWFVLLCGTAFNASAACTFRTNPGAITFTSFDPSAASIQTASTSARVNCTGNISPTWAFTGSNGSAPLRMKHATASFYIPYSVAATFVSGPNNNQIWNITATVLGTDYQNAQVGSYSDLLTATITP